MANKIKFEANVRENYSAFGHYGKIVSRDLAKLINKRVKVVVEEIKEKP